MKTNEKKYSLLHKIVTIVSFLTSISAIVLATLDILDIWNEATNISIPLLGVTMLCQAYTAWNTSRKIAYFSIGAAVLILISAIIKVFIK